MTNDKVNEVLSSYATRLRGPANPRRLSEDERTAHISTLSVQKIEDHLLWMVLEALSWGPERLEKKFRWLGFIQGAMWMHGLESIEAAKEANKPSEEDR